MAGVEHKIITQGPVVLFRWRNTPSWPVEYASPNAVEVFGWTAEEFMQGDVRYAELIAPSSIDRVTREVEEATRAGAATLVHEPYEIIHRDGSTRWLYDATQILRNDAGETTHYIGYVIDVTDRIADQRARAELEEQLLHAQKLESLGLLAGGVAHDFNNLLTGILGHATLALKQGPLLAPEVTDHLVQIEKLAEQAAELTRQLLAYTGRGTFVVEPCDLGALVEEMSGMLGIVISKKAQFVIERSNTAAVVMGDRAQLQQVVMNLITNASDALEARSGTIRVRVYERHLDQTTCDHRFGDWNLEAGHYIMLEVQDNGVGMDEETQRRLFDPFFTTKVSGRGLGMSAVLGIVRGHHGALRVESAPGRGTTFELVFPRVEEKIPQTASLPQRDEWRGAGTVLVVDDQASVRSVACRILEHLGFDTLCASNGARALELFRTHQTEIVLVLLDLTMPVMDGHETLDALLALQPDLPVVMSSGYDEGVNPTAATGRARGFLHKPYRLQQMREVLRRALE